MFAIVIGLICCTGLLVKGERQPSLLLGEIGRGLMCACGDEHEGEHLLSSDVADYEIPDDELFASDEQ